VCFPVWMSSYTNVHLVWLHEKLAQYKYSTKYYHSFQCQYANDGMWWNDVLQNPRENVDSPLLSPLGHHRDKEKEQQHKEKKEVVTVNEMCASPQGPPLDYSFLGIIISAWECTHDVCLCVHLHLYLDGSLLTHTYNQRSEW